MAGFRVLALFAFLLVACTATPGGERHVIHNDVDGSAAVPIAAGAPRGLPTLEVGPLRMRQLASISIAGALPAEPVKVVASVSGAGPGPCPAVLGGLCLDLVSPVKVIATLVTNAAGEADFTLLVPDIPGVELCFQAAIARGPFGVDSVVSASQCATVSADVPQSVDVFVALDQDDPTIVPIEDLAELADLLGDLVARVDYQKVTAEMGHPPLDFDQVVAGVMFLPPGAGFVEPLEVVTAFVPLEGHDISDADIGGDKEFVDGVLLVDDRTHSTSKVLGLVFEEDAAEEITGGTVYFVDDGGVASAISIDLSSFLDPSLNHPIDFDGVAGNVVFTDLGDVIVDLLPDKYKKTGTGDFVGAKRAVCLGASCIAIKKGCGFLAKLLICGEVSAAISAACAPSGPGAAACDAAAGLICGVIVGKICRKLAEDAGLTAQNVCDAIGIEEDPC